ncbi:hypothetical protein [Photorhabdus caribbeanensis]|uniref:hypothetical protein n=1 Tax=Photorhabdus caribbeanensis TaxID=1004165 RepID=UPI001BD48091|nr:hypothetical protein [Photorhabdus caribbeanensis]
MTTIAYLFYGAVSNIALIDNLGNIGLAMFYRDLSLEYRMRLSMMRKYILAFLLLNVSGQINAAEACPIGVEFFSVNKERELCFKGKVLSDNIDEPHKVLQTVISKDKKSAAKLISYPAKSEDPEDDCCGFPYHYELYLKRIKGDDEIESKMVVSGKGHTAVQIGYDKKLCPTWNISLSPDASKTYLECMRSATANEIRSVDNRTGKISDVITYGNGLDIVESGRYEGYIITEEHLYKEKSGSYDRYYLVSPDGKKSIPLSDEWDKVEDFLKRSR